MALDDVVSVNISLSSASVAVPGFGIPLILAYHTRPGPKVRAYSAATALSAMVADGFSTTTPAYKMASLVLSQSPRPSVIKIGKRSTAPTQTFTLKCLSAVEGDVYSINIGGTAVTYTVLAAATTSTVATAIELLVEAVTAVSSVSSTDTITATVDAGTVLRVDSWTPNFSFTDTTADPGLAADLNALRAEDDNWYAFCVDTPSKATIQGCAAWVETQKKLFATHTCDRACGDNASSTDVMAAEKTLAHRRTWIEYCGSDTQAYHGAAMLGSRLPAVPGSDTWAHKTLSGIPAETLATMTVTEELAILAKNGNVYTNVGGVNVSRYGKAPSGEYLDVMRFIDWQTAAIQTELFAYIASQAKVPYTDLGTEQLATVVRKSLARGVKAGGLVDGSVVVSTTPVADVSPSDKTARAYGGISFTATLAGAIHTITLNGTVGV